MNTVTVLVLLTSAAACTRLPPESQPGMPGSVPIETLDDNLTIPAEWGALASVSNDPLSAEHTSLWFVDEEGTVRMASYNRHTSQFEKTVAVIRRR